MSYTIPVTIEVEYTDHEARVERSGDTVRAVAVPVKRTKEIDINVDVDTTPFDFSVDVSAENISKLTGAIVGFKAANVAVKKANEEVIVGHVTSGFLNMIEQNINLQNVELEADANALAGELKQQCDELVRKHDVMNKDFNRIKSRYTDLFDNIDKEFRNRIHALLKPCFDFVSQVKNEQNRRTASSLLSMATTGGRESDEARIAIQASRMKENATTLIQASKNFITANGSLNRTSAVFALGDNRPATIFAPILIMTRRDDTTNGDATQWFLNPIVASGKDVEENMRKHPIRLREVPMSGDNRGRIDYYFTQRLGELDDGTPRSRRLIEQIRRLYESNTMNSFA